MSAIPNMKQIILSITCCVAICSWVQAQDGGLLVIGNSESVPSELQRNQLKSVLKGEQQRWKDGTKVVIALMNPDTPTGRNTCTRVYNMSGDELQKYFLSLVFQGKARAPNFFDTNSELEAFVAKTPGAIGVLNQTTDNSIKTVLIDGNKLL
jgi:ABC-type phosphate transport system substrate-binding protein